MKIAYTVGHFPYDSSKHTLIKKYNCGGAENAAFSLAIEMKKRGHSVDVYTTSYNNNYESEFINDVHIHRYPTNICVNTSNISYEFLKGNYDGSPELVHTHFDISPAPIAGFRYSKNKKKPLILTYHGDWVSDYGNIIRRLSVDFSNKFLVKKVLNQASVIISPSTRYAEISPFLKNYLDKIKVVPNGVDTNNFSNMDKESTRKLLNLDGIENIILFLGFLSPYKGPDILMNTLPIVAKEYPDVKFLFAGKGVMLDKLKQLALNLGVSENTIFLGYVSDENKSYYYNAADIFILPSIMATECYPLTILESMACGTPIIASEIGGIPDLIEDSKNGLLCKPNNKLDLANKIIQLLGDNNSLKNMSNECLSRSKNFTWEKIAEQTESIYEEIVY